MFRAISPQSKMTNKGLKWRQLQTASVNNADKKHIVNVWKLLPDKPTKQITLKAPVAFVHVTRFNEISVYDLMQNSTSEC